MKTPHKRSKNMAWSAGVEIRTPGHSGQAPVNDQDLLLGSHTTCRTPGSAGLFQRTPPLPRQWVRPGPSASEKGKREPEGKMHRDKGAKGQFVQQDLQFRSLTSTAGDRF